MGRYKLAFETLAGGLPLQKANQALDRIVRDVLDRGSVEKPRSVILQIQVTPGWDVNGGFPTAKPLVDYAIKENYPPIIGSGIFAKPGASSDGEEILTVDIDLPQNDPNQLTIFENLKIDHGTI